MGNICFIEVLLGLQPCRYRSKRFLNYFLEFREWKSTKAEIIKGPEKKYNK